MFEESLHGFSNTTWAYIPGLDPAEVSFLPGPAAIPPPQMLSVATKVAQYKVVISTVASYIIIVMIITLYVASSLVTYHSCFFNVQVSRYIAS